MNCQEIFPSKDARRKHERRVHGGRVVHTTEEEKKEKVDCCLPNELLKQKVTAVETVTKSNEPETANDPLLLPLARRSTQCLQSTFTEVQHQTPTAPLSATLSLNNGDTHVESCPTTPLVGTLSEQLEPELMDPLVDNVYTVLSVFQD